MKNKLKFLVMFALLIEGTANAQVGIGTANPDESSLLDVSSTTKGLLLPRVTSGASVTNPATGLLIFNITDNQVQVNSGTPAAPIWTPLGVNIPKFSAVCVGFSGIYCPTIALSGATFSVTLTNNDTSVLQVTPLTSNLVLSFGSGVSVASVSPSTVQSINPSASLVITYTLAGTPSSGLLTANFDMERVNCCASKIIGFQTFVSLGSSNPTTIQGFPMNNITHIASGYTSIITSNGLPSGVSASLAGNTLTISGTPTTVGTYNYTIKLVDDCGIINYAGGTITVVQCGAFVAAGVYKEFACHNLGATNTAQNPNFPNQSTGGNYYQWGKIGSVATSSTPSGTISGWSTSNAATNSWATTTKTAQDPCPVGYKVPSEADFAGVIDPTLNTISRIGTFATSTTYFSAAIHFGPSTSEKTLTLQANGNRAHINGLLHQRGNYAYYWTSGDTDNSALSRDFLFINSSTAYIDQTNSGSNGMSVRCIKE